MYIELVTWCVAPPGNGKIKNLLCSWVGWAWSKQFPYLTTLQLQALKSNTLQESPGAWVSKGETSSARGPFSGERSEEGGEFLRARVVFEDVEEARGASCCEDLDCGTIALENLQARVVVADGEAVGFVGCAVIRQKAGHFDLGRVRNDDHCSQEADVLVDLHLEKKAFELFEKCLQVEIGSFWLKVWWTGIYPPNLFFVQETPSLIYSYSPVPFASPESHLQLWSTESSCSILFQSKSRCSLA
ncbi:hypothetical protein V8F06_004376 [Rhypophila decipiens]